MKPGPASYRFADTLKKRVKVLWKYTQPSDFEPRISRNLSVKSLKQYAENRDFIPGPGFYRTNNTTSCESISRPYSRGVPMSRDSSERCKLVIRDNVSPGPSKYQASLASQRL